MDDLISRQHILLQLAHNKSKGDEEWELAVLNDMETVRNAPSVTPKQAIDYARHVPTIELRAKGKWDFIGDNMFMCTSCGAIYTAQQLEHLKQRVTDSCLPPHCPNCGNYNGGEQ